MAINWTAMTADVEAGFDLIIAIMAKVPDIIIYLVPIIILLAVPMFATRLLDKIVSIFGKIKF